jgi:hypothetical protein
MVIGLVMVRVSGLEPEVLIKIVPFEATAFVAPVTVLNGAS